MQLYYVVGSSNCRKDWKPYPNLNDYFDRMRTTPHCARTAPASPADIGRKPAAKAA